MVLPNIGFGFLRAPGLAATVRSSHCTMVPTRCCCSFSTRVVLGTSPRRWPLGMFALASSSPSVAVCSRSRPILRCLKSRSQLRMSMRSRSRQTLRFLSGCSQLCVSMRSRSRQTLRFLINLAVPSKVSTCKCSLPPVASVLNVVFERLRSNCAILVFALAESFEDLNGEGFLVNSSWTGRPLRVFGSWCLCVARWKNVAQTLYSIPFDQFRDPFSSRSVSLTSLLSRSAVRFHVLPIWSDPSPLFLRIDASGFTSLFCQICGPISNDFNVAQFGQFRDPVSRVVESFSWLCHFGEKPFSLCLCLGCCVSRVFSTSFFVAVSPCQQIISMADGAQLLELPPMQSALEVCWQGTTAKKNAAHSHIARRDHTPGGTRVKSRGCGFTQGQTLRWRSSAAEFKALQCTLTGHETASESRVKTAPTTTTTTTRYLA